MRKMTKLFLATSFITYSCEGPNTQTLHSTPSGDSMKQKKKQKRTAAGIPTWSPTVVLICRSTAYVWQSGRDAQFSADCGRTCMYAKFDQLYPYQILRFGESNH
ncbi:hypothetical protein M438DRAFT_17024 [Aureobasidium pullulans EXF-150]|uniref:Uncharacterized protein n=1 Tax=Aureobasidium pullulans EXF-150 TaxID=1043002 RepID=A0A074XWE7_AURPU|nr:uncharacterized protein M438DRAFT_17024 [Aureobasidium pullulans EXF-150]KEQ89923.1 hypothetical protein M438DRAFT_17024 [Aureobasidium pullulans EXF-150]